LCGWGDTAQAVVMICCFANEKEFVYVIKKLALVVAEIVSKDLVFK
jgi:hypothetical protein